MAGTLRAEHGVSAENVKIGRQGGEEEVSWELLDGEDVSEEGGPAETAEREGVEHIGGGKDGSGEENHIRVLLAEIVRISEEGGANGGGGGGVIGAGVGE